MQTIQHGLRLTIGDQDSHDLSSIFTFVTQAKIGGRMLLRDTGNRIDIAGIGVDLDEFDVGFLRSTSGSAISELLSRP